MINWKWVAFKGMLGWTSRYAVVQCVNYFISNPLELPIGTIIVNIIGCFVIGLLTALFTLKATDIRPELQLFLVVGFLGGFTTFSSFGLEIFTLLKHHPWVALFDVVIQLVFGLVGVAGGFALGHWLV